MPDQEPLPAKTENPASPIAPTPLQWFREIVTAVIALTIVALASWSIVATFCTAKYPTWKNQPAPDVVKAELDGRDKAFGREKDVLLYVLGLMGTVTGYFFGRVPAESHADKAEEAAGKAQNNADEARQSEAKAIADKSLIKQSAMTSLDQAIPLLEAPSRDVVQAGAEGESRSAAALKQIKALRDSLARF